MIPAKGQWKKWSMPSKMTAVGYYLAIFSLAWPLFWFGCSKFYDWLSSKYDVVGVEPSAVELDKALGGHYQERVKDIKVSYPRVSHFLPNDFLDSINKDIESSAMGYFENNLYEYSFEYIVGVKTPSLLSLRMDQYYYYYPAINGNGSVTAINIDLSRRQVVDFFDVFDARRDALNGVKSIVLRGIPHDCSVFEDAFWASGYIPRFFIKETGIEFIFSEYEVTPGVCGSFSVSIDYDELGRFIRPDGTLGRVVPSTGEWQAGKHFENALLNALSKIKEK